MILKSLEIQGFKSFPDKTSISFGRGLTAVVGPNGSGKSNISDAMRWVLGEQSTRSLRGSKMEDVIFTGTKARKSQGFAEVSLVIDNSDRTLEIDSDEVVITRRYDRSGESEYRINQTNVRLRDVNELFMDTGLGRDGYAMVGQGRIAEIVQTKSEERREIFEEAAGISKYRYRKTEAERKLSAAQENLVRLLDILSELEDRVEPLREQSEKAKRFLELSEEKKTLEISVWSQNLLRINRALKDQDDRLLARRLEQEETEQQAEDLEQQIQDIYRRMQQCLVEMDELRRRKEETEQQAASFQSQIAVCENDLHHHEENRRRIQQELDSSGLSEEQLVQERREQENTLSGLEQALEQLAQELKEKEASLYTLTEQADRYSESAQALGQALNALLVEQSQNELRTAQAERQLSQAQEKLAGNAEILTQREADLAARQQELSHANSLMEQLKERLASLQNVQAGCQMKLSGRQKRLEDAQKNVSALELRRREKLQNAKLLEDLERNLEGFAFSVKAVLRQGKYGALQGILGTVSQLLEAGEAYSVAIEVALGGSMQHVVVENEQSAKSAIRFLKQENAGRATFLPLTSVKGKRMDAVELAGEDGFVALACELVRFEERYRGVVDSLLGRIAVVEDLDAAVRIARKHGYRFKLVTLDGQVVNAGGSMTGGSLKGKNQGILSRKSEIARLHAQADEIAGELSRAQEAQQAAQQELAAVQAQLEAVQSEMITVGEDKIRCEGEEKRTRALLEQETAQLEVMQREQEALRRELEQETEHLEAGRRRAKELTVELADRQEQLNAMQGEHSETSETRQRLAGELQELRLRELELQKDIQSARRQLEELDLRGQAAQQQREALLEQLAGYEREDEDVRRKIEALREEILRARERADQMEEAARQKREERDALEQSTTRLRQEERTLSAKKETVMQEIARLEERVGTVQKEYDAIINKLWEEYQLTRSEADGLAQPVEDLAAAERQLQALRGKIRGLGSVNVAAIEEYREVSERYEFLSGQLKDVEQSKSELESLIAELTGKMEELFAESFEQINLNFQKIFVELFGGGRAELKLSDPEHVLESGIDIFVEPPGKIIKSLSLLSGGEQAFVAIAIYFAILKVHPAPFCILDEIEAALDDVNVGKYAAYLRLMSDNTQFIMITHRRGTMEEADVLYGVTMQEDGVSKLLRLDLSEVEQRIGKLEA